MTRDSKIRAQSTKGYASDNDMAVLSREALTLCNRLSKAYHADRRKRNILGRPSGDKAYQHKNRRIWRKACDRWRRRAGR